MIENSPKGGCDRHFVSESSSLKESEDLQMKLISTPLIDLSMIMYSMHKRYHIYDIYTCPAHL